MCSSDLDGAGCEDDANDEALRWRMASRRAAARAAEDAALGPLHVLERRHGLAQIVERGAVVKVEHLPVIHPHPDRDYIVLSANPPLILSGYINAYWIGNLISGNAN